MMGATHYLPWHVDEIEIAPCGTFIGEYSHFTGDWKNVTCKRCLSKRSKIDAGISADEKEVVRQMGDFVDFVKSNEAEEAINKASKEV